MHRFVVTAISALSAVDIVVIDGISTAEGVRLTLSSRWGQQQTHQ